MRDVKLSECSFQESSLKNLVLVTIIDRGKTKGVQEKKERLQSSVICETSLTFLQDAHELPGLI